MTLRPESANAAKCCPLLYLIASDANECADRHRTLVEDWTFVMVGSPTIGAFRDRNPL
jgi:hypothetical protein